MINKDDNNLFAGKEPRQELSGEVDSHIFVSDDERYSVFRIKSGNTRINVTLNSAPPLIGQNVRLFGQWVVHPRFGEQFKADGITVEAPASVNGIERFLASGVIDGVGEAVAKRIIKAFGRDALEVIEKQPNRLLSVKGIGQKTAKKIHESYLKQSELRDLMLWLEEHGLSGAYAARIFKEYSSNSLDILENHPYLLARDITGIGFATADAIAATLGIDKLSDERIAAGINHTIEQATQKYGHCCIPEVMLTEKTAELLKIETSYVWSVYQQNKNNGKLITEDAGENVFVYSPRLYRAERETAARLLKLAKNAEYLSGIDTGMLVRKWERKSDFCLAKEQFRAVESILVSGVFVLTGGPGTGKTTVLKAVIDILETIGQTVLLAAPTGRAAKRMTEATGKKATTIHRLLEAQASAAGKTFFGRDESYPLEADTVIIDEVSMIDISLMAHLLAALPEGCNLILVGDADQLPSVGPGSVLKDILRSKRFPQTRLKQIFRQEDQNDIVLYAHNINSGIVPDTDNDGNFIFLEHNDADEIVDIIIKTCTRVLPEAGYSSMFDAQVLSPMHKQTCGVINLNLRLQAANSLTARFSFAKGTR